MPARPVTRRSALALPLPGLALPLLGLALPLLGLARAGRTDAWPDRPVRVVVPYSPGGGADTVARILFTRLGERAGQPCVIENRGGGAGTIGKYQAMAMGLLSQVRWLHRPPTRGAARGGCLMRRRGVAAARRLPISRQSAVGRRHRRSWPPNCGEARRCAC